MDSDNLVRSKTDRVLVTDLGQRGLIVKVTGLQFGDAGEYWVGIDKMYADVMTPIKVVVTEGENEAFQFNNQTNNIIRQNWSAM